MGVSEGVMWVCLIGSCVCVCVGELCECVSGSYVG